jgi:hypothetical protein
MVLFGQRCNKNSHVRERVLWVPAVHGGSGRFLVMKFVQTVASAKVPILALHLFLVRELALGLALLLTCPARGWRGGGGITFPLLNNTAEILNHVPSWGARRPRQPILTQLPHP